MDNLEGGKISGPQLMGILITIVLPTAILFLPALAIKTARQDGWITPLSATIIALLFARVMISLAFRFPNKTLFQYMEDILGKIPGRIVGLGYLFFFLYTNAIIMREFADFIQSAFLPETPLVVFTIFLIILASSIVRNGIEVMARMNQFIILLMFSALAIIFVFVAMDFEIMHLLPFFENGIKPIIKGTLTPLSWRSEIVLMLMMIPYLNNYKEARPAAYKAVIALGILLSVQVIFVLGVFGLEAAFFSFPTYVLAFYISIGGFIERIEVFILALWVSGVVMKVAIWYYAAALASSQYFNLKDYKPVVYPLGIIQGAMSIFIFENTREIAEFFAEEFPFYAYTFEIILPAVLLFIAVVRKKGSGVQ